MTVLGASRAAAFSFFVFATTALAQDGKTVVDFSVAFDNVIDNVRTVVAHPFDEKVVISEGTYTLSGNTGSPIGLELTGGTLELLGDVVIRAFDPSYVPPPNETVAGTGGKGPTPNSPGAHGERGGTGATGATGVHGRDAARITIRFYEVVGPGSLTIINNGSNGGRGGIGGKGGPGGDGRAGRNREGAHGWDGCIGSRPPTNGGNGGPGGTGGTGGTGGRAGSGGTIVYNSDLQEYLDAGVFVFSAPAGTPGAGGPGGQRGDGGAYGHYGRGSECGGGGRHGSNGGPGNPGPSGQGGAAGAPGQVLVSG